MKFQPLVFLKLNGKNVSSPISPKEKKKISSDPLRRDVDEWSNQGNVSLVAQKNGWFLFRIMKREQYNQHSKKSAKVAGNLKSPVNNGNSTNDTASTSGTNTRTPDDERETPVSFICIDTPVPIDTLPEGPLHKRSSATIIRMHGLDRDDSIISYMKEVDDAYNQMVVVCENDTDCDEKRNDDDSYENERFYVSKNEIEQSISIITMDPALLYRHSIIIDEYSWKSFAVDENDEDESTSSRIVPVRYYEI